MTTCELPHYALNLDTMASTQDQERTGHQGGFGAYKALFAKEGGVFRPASLQETIDSAKAQLSSELRGLRMLDSPKLVRDYLILKLAKAEHEIFGMLFLDAQIRIICYKELFRGTLTSTTVHAREVVKEVLAINAHTVVLVHNHPSGTLEPSRAYSNHSRPLRPVRQSHPFHS